MKRNSIIEKYVVCHKQIVPRMRSSAGGAYCAIIETLAKNGYYFTGTSFDEEMKLSHKVTNNPEEIASIIGFKPIVSSCDKAFQRIKELIEVGEKVAFCGTQSQCQELLETVGETENLLVIDVIASNFIQKKFFNIYLQEKETSHGSKVTDIQFYDKEFTNRSARRIFYADNRVEFVEHAEQIDRNLECGTIAVPCSEEPLDNRIGDITIGAYRYEAGDDLGYSYVSINTEKGRLVFNDSKKRLQVIMSQDEVNFEKVLYNETIGKSVSLEGAQNDSFSRGKLVPFLRNLHLVYYELSRISQFNISAIYKFFKYNFLKKSIKTDFQNGGFVFFAPNAVVQIDDSSQIELHGPLEIGVRRIEASRQETRLWMQPNSKLIVRKKCMFGSGSNVEIYRNAVLDVGNLFSNSDIVLICGEKIKIGQPVNIAKGCTVRDTNGHLVAIPGYKQSREVEIGNHTWICSNSTIMPGVKIGDGAIVGANSFVARSIPSFSLYQGNPAVEVASPRYFRM